MADKWGWSYILPNWDDPPSMVVVGKWMDGKRSGFLFGDKRLIFRAKWLLVSGRVVGKVLWVGFAFLVVEKNTNKLLKWSAVKNHHLKKHNLKVNQPPMEKRVIVLLDDDTQRNGETRKPSYKPWWFPGNTRRIHLWACVIVYTPPPRIRRSMKSWL